MLRTTMDGFVLSKNCKEQSSRKSGKICCCRHRGEMASGLTRFRFQTPFLSSFLTWCRDGHQINSYQRYNWIIVYCGKMIITKVAFVITVMMKIFMNLSLDCWSYDVDSVIVTWYQTTKPNVRRLENQSFFFVQPDHDVIVNCLDGSHKYPRVNAADDCYNKTRT